MAVPARIAAIKQRILRADTSRLEQHLQQVLSSADPAAQAKSSFNISA